MHDDRAARATRRDYCRGCATTTLHPFYGWVTDDARENTIRPRAYYRSCSRCGLVVMVLGDVTDAEGLARFVLDEHLRPISGAATAINAPFGPPPLDWEGALSFLMLEAWRLYSEKWDPGYGDGRVTFRAYGTGTLRLRLDGWIRDETGDASGRSKGRVHPKAHAPSVSVSLEQLVDGASAGAGEQGQTTVGWSPDDLGPMEAALGGATRDFADDRSPDLAWALAGRSRAPARPQ